MLHRTTISQLLCLLCFLTVMSSVVLSFACKPIMTWTFMCPKLDIVAAVPCSATCRCANDSSLSVVDRRPHVCSQQCRWACLCTIGEDENTVSEDCDAYAVEEVEGSSASPATTAATGVKHNKPVIAASSHITNEGFGSFFSHHKPLIMLALALDASIYFVTERMSTHGYNVPKLLNSGVPYTETAEAPHERCRVTDEYWSTEIALSLCMDDRTVEEVRDRFRGCTKIEYQGPRGLTWVEDMQDCIQPYVQSRFLHLFGSRAYRDSEREFLLQVRFKMGVLGRISVGIHLRFGDENRTDLYALDYRSIPIWAVSTFYRTVLSNFSERFDFYLFMERHDQRAVAMLNIPNTLVVDTGDDLFDLQLFSEMDLVIHGISTFPVLAAVIAPGKLIVTDNTSHPKFRYRRTILNEVISWNDTSYDIEAFIKRKTTLRHQMLPEHQHINE